jgi:thiamine-phosphate pyrophosphorylase
VRAFLITSPEYYTHNETTFREKLYYVLVHHKPYVAIYRDKENPHYESFAKLFLEVCREVNIKGYLHGDVAMACRLGADGVHLTSSQFDAIKEAKKNSMACGISTHTMDELKRAEILGADYVTFSPIFASPNKGEPKGLAELSHAIQSTSIPIVALGGIIEPWHVEQIASCDAYGFASIRYFYS